MPQITCPACGVSHKYDIKSLFRPFCSDRCKLIDLGAWSKESYKIPVKQGQPEYDFGEYAVDYMANPH